jgi:hypothetical protein
MHSLKFYHPSVRSLPVHHISLDILSLPGDCETSIVMRQLADRSPGWALGFSSDVHTMLNQLFHLKEGGIASKGYAVI